MSERLYYFKAGDGNEYGPISAEEVTAWQKQGRMNSESLVRYEDSNDWVPLVNMPELTSPTVSTPPVLVTQSIEPPTQQPVRYEEHRGTTILILGILSLMAPPGFARFYAFDPRQSLTYALLPILGTI